MPGKYVGSVDFKPDDRYQHSEVQEAVGDNRTGSVYVFNDHIRLAVRVALASGRPLLLRGPSGWGKSSLAAASSKYLGWDYHEAVISSRTQARDLQWEVDLLLRLSDAQADGVNSDWKAYVRPRILWWAFDPVGADRQQALYQRQKAGTETGTKTGTADSNSDVSRRSVILIDEIDKADPDVPNNLLVALGSLQFEVEETGQLIKAQAGQAPLVFITTNEERALPAAFLRRCIELKLPALGADDPDGSLRRALLIDIATQHFAGIVESEYIQEIAEQLIPIKPGQGLSMPSPAEFNDTVRAASQIFKNGALDKKLLQQISKITLYKHEDASGEST
ncbi:MAG TPA: MoxR family ATPase [Terriglobales bacterium]|nr:MoxR family ATPase [Terriglobales bacterium]